MRCPVSLMLVEFEENNKIYEIYCVCHVLKSYLTILIIVMSIHSGPTLQCSSNLNL